MIALGTFTAAANGRTFPGGTRINDLIFLTTALGATHKTTGNGGCTFVTHKSLGCQRKPAAIRVGKNQKFSRWEKFSRIFLVLISALKNFSKSSGHFP
jgi:hypothetical protein